MKSYDLFRQYIWLISTISRYGRITLDELNANWTRTEMSMGQPMPRSTFNRHKDAIEDMFGVIIDCNRRDGFRYYIGNPEVLQGNSVQNWMLNTLSVGCELSESLQVHSRVLLEQIPSSGENLHQFINAMKRGVRIHVWYKRYGSEYETEMIVEPYCVKLFNRRWYGLVKYIGPQHKLFMLGLDRVQKMELTDDRFELDRDFDASVWFSECYGIVRSPDTQVERIVIRAFGKEAFYMRDLPLHSSQKEIATTDRWSDFELRLRPSVDFIGPLLQRGSSIKVLEPEWLADEVYNRLLATIRLYEENI